VRRLVCSSRVRNSKKCVFSLARKVDSELALRMSFGSEFRLQTFRAATQNACLAFQCVSTALRDAEHRWTAETASSLGVVGFRRCTEHQPGEKPDADTEDKEDHPETNPTALRWTQVHSGYSVCAGLIRSCEPSLQTPRHSYSHETIPVNT